MLLCLYRRVRYQSRQGMRAQDLEAWHESMQDDEVVKRAQAYNSRDLTPDGTSRIDRAVVFVYERRQGSFCMQSQICLASCSPAICSSTQAGSISALALLPTRNCYLFGSVWLPHRSFVCVCVQVCCVVV